MIARRFVGVGILPVVVIAISAGTRVIAALVLGGLVAVGIGVVAWWRFRYRVLGGRLELHSGVVGRHVRTIPLDRVRGVVVTEPFLHRLLGLVRVEVEAAAGGESDAELSLAAVSVAEADRLRESCSASGPQPSASPSPRRSTGLRTRCSPSAGSPA